MTTLEVLQSASIHTWSEMHYHFGAAVNYKFTLNTSTTLA
jgi:hypothetical protein